MAGANKVYVVEVPADITVADGLAEARVKARGVGITIDGDTSGGTFAGAAQGRYSVDGHTLRLEVEKKPAFVPWSLVESGLKRVFGEVTPGT